MNAQPVHACLVGKDEPLCEPLRVALQRDQVGWTMTTVSNEVTCRWCRELVEHVLEQGYVAVDDAGRLVATPGD